MQKRFLSLVLALLLASPAWTAVQADTETPVFVSGLVPEKFTLTYSTEKPNINLFSLQAYYDARNYNYISSVKNQGVNGLCWAFATYGAVEANMLKNGYPEQDLSELHMAYSTSDRSGNFLQGFDREPGGGGNRYYALSYLMRGTNLSGAVDESQDPYDEYIHSEIQPRALAATQSKKKKLTVLNMPFISGRGKADAYTAGLIKAAVLQYGAVAAEMYWDYANVAWQEGTYYFNYADSGISANAANHVVLIIGWDDNFDKSKFREDKQPSSDGAWLIKNSWGTAGLSGYFWISYEDTNFPQSAYAIDGAELYDSGENVYEYDYTWEGSRSFTESINGHTYYARIFTVQTEGEWLKQVKVNIAAGTTVSVDIIPNFTNFNGYDSGSFSANTTKTFTYPGYYTIDLDSPVTLGAADSQFAVIVKVNTENGAVLGCDINWPAIYSAGSETANAYVLTQNRIWSDARAENYSIKAVTVMQPKILGIKDIGVSGLKVDLKRPKQSGAILAVAFYQGKKLLGVKTKEITESGEITVNDIELPPKADIIKAMMWSGMSAIQPICDIKAASKINGKWICN